MYSETSNTTGNHSDPHPGSMTLSIDNLYPAIVKCFVVILTGYIAGRASLITSTQGKGIGTFVSKFCLPALLFRSMVKLNFDTVDWFFLLGIGISKTVVFVGVVALTLLVKRPLNLAYAGLFGMFATQSNDFALGYPILKGLYEESHPEYLQYIYLIAPISLVLLNPIGFTMLEIHRQKQDTNHQRRKITVVLHVVKDVFLNPIVFMTVLGIAGNFLFKQNLPSVIDDILEVLGNAFSASALFYLGLSLVGKVQGQIGPGLIVPLLLIGAKTLLLPLITWQVVGSLDSGQTNDSKSISMYGFLYGTFPTAPSVFLYASQFSVAQDVVATGMVACTFLSAPLMFVSAKMMTVVVDSEMDYKKLLLSTDFDFSVISLVCNVWLLGLLFFSKKHRRMPHQFLICLVVCQSFACIGMIIYDGYDTSIAWQHYLQFVILLTGVFSTRCWAAMISLALYLLHCRSLCYLLRMKVWLYFFAIGLPLLGTGLLLIFGIHHMHDEIDPAFHYGIDQAILSVVMLVLCSVINIVFLILRQRNVHTHRVNDVRVRKQKNGNITNEVDSDRERLLPDGPDEGQRSRSCSKTKLLGDDRDGAGERVYSSCSGCSNNCDIVTQYDPKVRTNSTSIEDIVPFPEKEGATKEVSRTSSASSSSSSETFTDSIYENSCESGTCSYQQRRSCAGLLRCYHATNNSLRETEDDDVEVRHPKRLLKDEYQTNRFIILLLVLQCSMFMGIFLCLWRLFNKGTSGIYVEIEFLDGFFNYGQSLVVFAIFGFDTRLVILPCIKRWRKFMYGTEVVHIPYRSELSDDDRELCDQFVKYHKDSCERDIVKNMKYRFRTYEQVFCGTRLCDWLIKVGLCHDRAEAINYGRTLVIGQIICHVTNEHHFLDMPYFYRFIDEDEQHS